MESRTFENRRIFHSQIQETSRKVPLTIFLPEPPPRSGRLQKAADLVKIPLRHAKNAPDHIDDHQRISRLG